MNELLEICTFFHLTTPKIDVTTVIRTIKALIYDWFVSTKELWVWVRALNFVCKYGPWRLNKTMTKTLPL